MPLEMHPRTILTVVAFQLDDSLQGLSATSQRRVTASTVFGLPTPHTSTTFPRSSAYAAGPDSSKAFRRLVKRSGQALIHYHLRVASSRLPQSNLCHCGISASRTALSQSANINQPTFGRTVTRLRKRKTVAHSIVLHPGVWGGLLGSKLNGLQDVLQIWILGQLARWKSLGRAIRALSLVVRS